MNNQVAPNNWLASGGAYWLMFGATVIIAISFAVLVLKVSNRTRLESDGCLMAILVILLTLLGSGVGFWVSRYPSFVVTSILGALALPSLATSVWLRFLSRKG